MENIQDSTVMRLPKFSQNDLGSIIGPNKSDCEKKPFLEKKPSLRKNVLSKAWNSFSLYKEKEGIDGGVPKLFIQLAVDEEGVFATVKTESNEMMKFAQFHLNKYQEEFIPPKKKMVYTFYLGISHTSVPQLIGRRAATVSKMKENAIECMMDGDAEPEYPTEEIDACRQSYLKIDPFTVRGDFSEFSEKVNASERSSFVGWPPESGEEIVKVFISSYATKGTFDDFITYLMDEVDEQAKKIRERAERFSSRKEEELRECYEALDL